MSPRFDRRSNKTPRNRRSGNGRREEGNIPFSRGPSASKPSLGRGGYRPKRDESIIDESSGPGKGDSSRRGRFRGEGRRINRFDEERNFSRSGFRREDSGRKFGRAGSLRRNSPPDWRARPRIQSKQVDFVRKETELLNSQPEQEIHGEGPAEDIIWGRHSVQAVLESGRPIHRIWCTPEMRSSSRFLRLLKDAKSSGILLEEVTWARLGQLTCGAVHQGIVLQIAAAETLSLQTLIDGCDGFSEAALLLALDGLTDPQNLGAIVRSAEALGAHGLVLPQRRSAGLTGSVAKVATGALEHLPVARVVNLNRSLEQLKNSGYRVIGLADDGDLTLPEVDLEGPLVVVTGSEGKGISLLTRRHCDHLVRIPLRGVTTSLNASVATAIFLYEVARRGWMKGIYGQTPSPRMVRATITSKPKENNGLDFLGDSGQINEEIDKPLEEDLSKRLL